MPHGVSLIATLAAGLGLAMIFGLLAASIRLPPLIGYLVAGIAIGPATPGFVGDVELAGQLAEIGVMLMMFGVGLHLSLDDLLSVRRIALPGAIVQIVVATALGGALSLAWGWSPGAALVFGLSLSVASTVVLLRALEAKGALRSVNGQIAIGWLVVEDLVVVLVLVLLPPLAAALGGTVVDPVQGVVAPGSLISQLVVTVGKLAVFIAVMLLVAPRLLPRLMWMIARTGWRELFTLGVIAIAVGVAFGAARLFSVSFALGAFFAGMVMRESALSHRAAQESLPLRDAFSVLFFVSVGMLFDPAVILQQPGKLLAVVLIIVVGKTLAAIALVLAFRYPLSTALTVGAGLAQIGEFSFILAGLGVTLGLLPPEGRDLVLAGALISIAVNPLVFATIAPVQKWVRARSAVARRLAQSDDPLAELPPTVDPLTLTGHLVVVGYGRVGRRIGEALEQAGLRYVVVELNREIVERLRDRQVPAVSGDAAEPAVLIQAHIARARLLVMATPESLRVRKMVEVARALNPSIQIVVRTHSEEEADLLQRDQIGTVFMGEHELALAMIRHILAATTAVAEGGATE